MSTGYSIMMRHYTKVDEMSPKTLMASAGFMARRGDVEEVAERKVRTIQVRE